MFLVICRKCVREIQVKQNLTRITRRPVLPKDLCTFVILSRYILLIMRNILGKSYRENENTFYVQCLFFPRRTCRLQENGVAREATEGNLIRRTRISCWLTKATDTHSEYVIIIAFPRQQWLCKPARLLRYTYVA